MVKQKRPHTEFEMIFTPITVPDDNMNYHSLNAIFISHTVIKLNNIMNILLKLVECPPVQYVEFATYSASGRSSGDHVNYTCDDIHELVDLTTSTVTCQENGLWSATPVCESRHIL